VRGSAAVVRVELMGSGGQGGWWLVGFSSFAQAQGACPGSAFSGLMDTARWGGGGIFACGLAAERPERQSATLRTGGDLAVVNTEKVPSIVS
jgi:hypothetical protein